MYFSMETRLMRMRSGYKALLPILALVRGKYTQRLRESSNVVVIEPELAKAFPNARVVNQIFSPPKRRLKKPEPSARLRKSQ